MEIVTNALAFALSASLCGIGWLVVDRNRLKSQITDLREYVAKKAKDPSYDCRKLLHDLTEGDALVKITRIEPLDVFIRRS